MDKRKKHLTRVLKFGLEGYLSNFSYAQKWHGTFCPWFGQANTLNSEQEQLLRASADGKGT